MYLLIVCYSFDSKIPHPPLLSILAIIEYLIYQVIKLSQSPIQVCVQINTWHLNSTPISVEPIMNNVHDCFQKYAHTQTHEWRFYMPS